MGRFSLSWTYSVIAVVTSGLCVLIATCVVLCHVYLRSRAKQPKLELGRISSSRSSVSRNRVAAARLRLLLQKIKDDFHGYILHYCTGLSIFFFYLMNALSLFYRLHDMRLFGSRNWCADHMRLVICLWTLGKCNMYLVLAARVHVAFHHSVFRYSQKLIGALYAMIILLSSPTVLFSAYLVDGHMEDIKGDAPNEKWVVCVSDIHRGLPIYGFLADLFGATLLLTLFTRPLRKLFRERDSQKRLPIARMEMQMLPLKYAVTTAIAVVSTMLSMLIKAKADMGLFLYCDAVVNMICLVIMTSRWKAVYWRLCAPLLWAIAYFDCCFDDGLRQNLELIVGHYTGAIDLESVGSFQIGSVPH